MSDNRIVDCLSDFLAEISVRKPLSVVGSGVGLVMASKGKGHKSGRGRGAASENEEFELEDDQVDGEPPEARAYRRLYLLDYTDTTQSIHLCLQQEQTAKHWWMSSSISCRC